jgi:hypothetical protein
MSPSSSRLRCVHIVLLLQAFQSCVAGNVHRRQRWSLPSSTLPVVSLHVAPSLVVSSSCTLRGGDLTPHSNPNDDLTDEEQQEQQQVVTVEAYVAAMEEKDAQDRSTFDANMDAAATETQDDDDDDDLKDDDNDDTNETRKNKESKADNAPTAEETAAATVGVKSHDSNNSNKKSNAVGDPDGEGSDDSDDDTDDWGEDMADMDIFEQGEMEDMDLIGDNAQVQVEVELLEEEDTVDEANSEEEPEEGSSSTAADAARGGGVGVRLGRLNRRKHRNSKDLKSNTGSSSTPATKTTVPPEELLAAWQPHVYLPPTASALQYLTDHARSIDGASKTRLDRRTMYASLLLEWRNSNGSPSARKFLEQPVSQALQAALSLATQPAWRKSFPRPSGIRLYDHDNHMGGAGSEHRGSATLAMQETIAMALVSKERNKYCSVSFSISVQGLQRGYMTLDRNLTVPFFLIVSLSLSYSYN